MYCESLFVGRGERAAGCGNEPRGFLARISSLCSRFKACLCVNNGAKSPVGHEVAAPS